MTGEPVEIREDLWERIVEHTGVESEEEFENLVNNVLETYLNREKSRRRDD